MESPNLEGNRQEALDVLKKAFESMSVDNLRALLDESFAKKMGIDPLDVGPTNAHGVSKEEYRDLAREILASKQE